MGPINCDLCGYVFRDGDVYVDGRLNFGTAWASMCVPCHGKHGAGFGTGKGQAFDWTSGLKLGLADKKKETGGAKLTFPEWMKRVDRAISARLGLGANDLADQPYADWWESGMTPKEAAEEAIQNEMDEFGFGEE